MNTFICTGRLTKEPELRNSTTGKSYCSFQLAVEDDYKDTSGNRVTYFLPFTAWESKADFISKYCKKGNKLAITGKLTSRAYQDTKSNQMRVMFDIVVNSVENLSPRESQTQQPQQAPQYQQPQQSYQANQPYQQTQQPSYQGYNNPQYQAPKPQYQQPPQPQFYADTVKDDDLPF